MQFRNFPVDARSGGLNPPRVHGMSTQGSLEEEEEEEEEEIKQFI